MICAESAYRLGKEMLSRACRVAQLDCRARLAQWQQLIRESQPNRGRQRCNEDRSEKVLGKLAYGRGWLATYRKPYQYFPYPEYSP